MTRLLLGPYSLTLNSVQQVNIPMSTVAVQLKNDSRWDVMVSFAYVAPSDTTDSLQGGWQEVALRHTNPVIPVQTPGTGAYEKALNRIGGNFLGKLWLCPTNNNLTALALSGVYSGLDNIWVICYDDGDDVPVSDSTTRQVDITNQPRVIALPPVPDFCVGASFKNSSSGTFQDTGSTFGSASGFVYSGAATTYNFYLYAATVSMRSTVSTLQNQAVLLSFQIFDSTNTARGIVTTTLWDTFLQCAGGMAFAEFMPAFPMLFQQIVPGSLTNLPLRASPVILSGSGSTGFPWACDWTIAWSFSAVNGNTGPGGIFGGAAGTTAEYAGEVY